MDEQSDGTNGQIDGVENQEEAFTVWHGLFLAEGIALGMGLLLPITPRRFGSGQGMGMANHFVEDPSYLQEAFASFVMTNVVLLILGVAFLIWQKRSA